MTSVDPVVVEALRALVDVLAKHGPAAHADFVWDALKLYESGSPAFEEKIASALMWGGAGAVWDNPPPQGTPDRNRFLSAMVILADFINDQAIGPRPVRERAASTASIFRQWLAQGL